MSPTRRPAAGPLPRLFVSGLLLAGGVWAADAPERVTFTFAPPAGANFLQREIFVETGRVGGVQQRITLASEVSLRISREAGRSYLHFHVNRAAAARNGKPSDPEMIAAMTGAETVQIVRPDGGLAKIDGLRRLYEKLLPTFPAAERGALEKRLRENRLEDRLRANWFEATEVLSGQNLELARDYYFLSAWPTEEGWIRHQTLLRLGPWEKTPHGPRLRVKLAYVADARADVPGATRIEARATTAFAPNLPGKLAKGFTLSGNSSRLVDPATLLVYKEQSVRRVQNRVELSEEMALTVSSEEQSDITLEPVPSAIPAKPASH